MREYLNNRIVGVIAPAGFGKTEEIVFAVSESEGRQLVLTHTRAGVAALKERLKRYNVEKNKYEVSTIASFCLKWCKAYPKHAELDDSFWNEKVDYQKVYLGATKVFENKWAVDVFKRSYAAVLIDEYQDCVETQHKLFMYLNQYIPVRIYGDPLQGIFYWIKNDPLVKWRDFSFPVVEPLQTPWRWKNTNPRLGDAVLNIRNELLPTLSGNNCRLTIENIPNTIVMVDSKTWNNGNFVYKIKGYKNIVYLTTIVQKQNSFSQHRGGYFQSDEPKDLSNIRELLVHTDKISGAKKALAWINIVSDCANSVKTELKSYINNLEKGSTNFSRIKKHEEIGRIIKAITEDCTPQTIFEFLRSINNSSNFKIYRKEYFFTIGRIYKYMIEENIGIEDAVDLLENNKYRMEQKPKFSRLSSRTVLTKGLEFECVIVDAFNEMDPRDFYVAITRATKMVYVLTDKRVLDFKGIKQ